MKKHVMKIQKLNHRLRVGLFFAFASTSAAAADTHLHEFNACGHEDHDNIEVRAQAATPLYWRDDLAANPKSWKRFKILGFNDFHGALESRTLGGRPVGGAAVLAAYLKAEIGKEEDSAIIVHAGDHVGASPPVSALLQDEPSIDVLNILANEHCKRDAKIDPECNLVGTPGNHEFDEGVAEMLRLINGGNHLNGPFLDANYAGTTFPYVSANVVYESSGKTVLPPYVIKRVKDMPVAFIGAVLKETPTIVTPSGVAGVQFLDEVASINKYIPEIQAQGVHAIVVTIHQGTFQSSYLGPTIDQPMELGADIGPIIKQLDDDVDIVVSGHRHQFTNALMENNNGKQILVTQAFANGTAYADIDVAIDPKTKDIVEKSAAIITTWADQGAGLNPDVKIAALVTQAVAIVEPLVNQVIGEATTDITRSLSNAGESALGNLIADAQRAAMGTDMAFMNEGGIRADLAAGQVTWGELFTIQPFGNDLVKMELTGQQVVDLLNQQWVGQTSARIMKSSGLVYTWNGNNSADISDDRVDVNSILINGQTIDLTKVYSVTVNSFMASGGDKFTVLTQGTNRVVGPVDLDALVNYIKSLPQPFSSSIEGRINRVN